MSNVSQEFIPVVMEGKMKLKEFFTFFTSLPSILEYSVDSYWVSQIYLGENTV